MRSGTEPQAESMADRAPGQDRREQQLPNMKASSYFGILVVWTKFAKIG